MLLLKSTDRSLTWDLTNHEYSLTIELCGLIETH